MRARSVLSNARTAILVVALAGPLAGCDVVFAFILAPFFPGQPLPPPPDLACPLDLAPADEAALPPLPATFTPALPEPRPGCDPGTKVLHRLNRTELDNTFRDLTGLDGGLAAQSFPADDFGAGFDNNAEVLATSPLFVEKLEAAAHEVVRQAMQRPGEEPVIATFEAEYGVGNSGYDLERGERLVSPGGDVSLQAILPNAAGTYAIRVRAGADGDDTRVVLVADGVDVLTARVTASADDKQIFEVRTTLDAGPVHSLGARTVEGSDATVAVDFFEVEGPFDVTALGPAPPARQRIVTCDLAARSSSTMTCVKEIVAGFGKRAWRRPLTDAEVGRFEGLVRQLMQDGDDVETALRSALTAVLLSPSFLYRVELDPDLSDTTPHALSDHELATRLSYFLWSSTPDDRLLTLADQGALQDPNVLETEARRMLDDPRSKALVKSFAGQWLFTRAVQGASPDPVRFPQFDEELRAAMQCETELTFDRFLRDESLSALDMVTLEETPVNARLAAHYGLEPPTDTLGHGWGVVSLAGTGRAGLLTQASILTVTSQPTRTSPTRRGRWVLENLLCTVPPPPPPGVEGLPEPPQGEETESVRERLENQHRNNPECASCHEMIDPFGFGLEHFDAVGRWRASDAGFRIDDSAMYMGDTSLPFDGPKEMGAFMRDDPQLPMCMTQKTMTYALGRGLDEAFCNVEDVTAKFAAGGYKMSDLVIEVVQSPAFRMRHAIPDDPALVIEGSVIEDSADSEVSP